MRPQRYLLGEISKPGSNIALGKNGLPEFFKQWSKGYQEAWLAARKRRVEAKLGFSLDEIVRDVVAKIKADQRAKKPTQRELYAQWDREAALAAALSGAVRNLRAVAPVRRTK